MALRCHVTSDTMVIIGPGNNGLSSIQCQAITWTNVDLLIIGPSVTNFSQIQIKILWLSFKKMHLIMKSAKWWPCCSGLNVILILCELTSLEYNGHFFSFSYPLTIVDSRPILSCCRLHLCCKISFDIWIIFQWIQVDAKLKMKKLFEFFLFPHDFFMCSIRYQTSVIGKCAIMTLNVIWKKKWPSWSMHIYSRKPTGINLSP